MPDAPLVSVAMISYKHKAFIAQALGSVLSQQRDFSIEIVVSDDRSPDGTGAEIDRIQSTQPELFRRLDPPTNVGMYENFRRVWGACRGRYIAVLEGDDYWHDPQKLAVQVKFMEAHPECPISGHRSRVLQWASESAEVELEPYPTERQPELSDISRLIQINFMHTCSIMYRRGVVPVLPPWLAPLPMVDWPLSILHAAQGPIGFLDHSLCTYRKHPGGVYSTTQTFQRQMMAVIALTAMRKNLPGLKPREFTRTLASSYEGLANLHYDRFLTSARDHAPVAAGFELWRYITRRAVSFWLEPRLIGRAILNRLAIARKIKRLFGA